MPPTAVLIRHAQGFHNVNKDYSIPDPELTELGISQCDSLRDSLKERFGYLSAEETVVVVSPMLRTLQTASVALDWLRDKGVRFVADADWQENGIAACDTGRELTPDFTSRFPHVDFSQVDPVWPDKTSPAGARYAMTSEAIVERGRLCLEALHARKEKVVFVVSHSAFLRAGVTRSWFFNADYRIFEFQGDELENGRRKIVQDESTATGGLGWSRTERVELGEMLVT